MFVRAFLHWYRQLKKSLDKGFDGMRVSGNEARLDRDLWKNFLDYERTLNNALRDKRMIVLCTYRWKNVMRRQYSMYHRCTK